MPVKQIVTTLLFYFFFVSVKGQTSRALLVAIDKYPSESGWNEIHATNDIYLLKPLLIKRNFAPCRLSLANCFNALTMASLVACSFSKTVTCAGAKFLLSRATDGG